MSSSCEHFGPKIVASIEDSIRVKKRITDEQISMLSDIACLLISALQGGKKLILFGNGGSAADAQHIAAELVNRFMIDRHALPAIALTTDSSILTSIANDSSFEEVFSRQVEAIGQEGDVAIGISTSGNSPNVLRGVRAARAKGIMTVGFTGEDGGQLKECVDICFRVPSQSTPRIQEVHITVAHALCELTEQVLCQSPV